LSTGASRNMIRIGAAELGYANQRCVLKAAELMQ
jgi:hypothetical protein